MEDPPRIHSDPNALARLREMQKESPAGEATMHDRLATAFASLLDALGKGEVEPVLETLTSEQWREGVEPEQLDAERYAFTRGLAAEAARALDRRDPWVMAAGIALRQAMGLWIRSGKASRDFAG